jgi:hypothetical protein
MSPEPRQLSLPRMTRLPSHQLSHSKLSMSGQSDHGHKILCVIDVLRRNFTVVNFNSKATHYAKDVRHPPSAERRTIALCVSEMTGGRGFAPNVRAANEWMRGTVATGRMGVCASCPDAGASRSIIRMVAWWLSLIRGPLELGRDRWGSGSVSG